MPRTETKRPSPPTRSGCRLALLIGAALICAALVAAVPARTEPIRIMPLGDSITESRAGHASYRYWLWQDLVARGHDADLVGSRTGVRGGPPLYPDFDQNHEGHWGWRSDQILDSIDVWVAAHPPRIALIHLGTNDLFQRQSIESTIGELEAIVSRLRGADPAVAVLLAQIIPMRDIYGVDSIPAFNAEVAALAAWLHRPDSPVIAVDQFTGFDPDEDTWDGVHPDESGEKKIAARWMERLTEILPDPSGFDPRGSGEVGFSILPPVPNPSRASVEFRLILPDRRLLRMSIHDAAGRRIAGIADEALGPGAVEVSWDGRSDAGGPVPPGVYYLRADRPSRARGTPFVLLGP